jgi:hypothetical protein
MLIESVAKEDDEGSDDEEGEDDTQFSALLGSGGDVEALGSCLESI